MNNIKRIILTGVASIFGGFMMAQSVTGTDPKATNVNQAKTITVNPRNDTREISPAGNKIDSKSAVSSYGSVKEMRVGRHHRHHHHRHHKHHRKNANQQEHNAGRHHKI